MAKDIDFMTQVKPTWCPGCGNFGIWTALRQALAELNLEPHQVVMSFDIGCCGNGANWHKLYGFHSLHGRPLPVAYAVKLANHDLKVIAISGDGGGYGEGGNHFVHTCRGNVDLTYIIHNNHRYSLTTGQASPTTEHCEKTKSTPDGLIEYPLNGMQVAITAGATFVAQGYADEVVHLKELFKKAIAHPGFSLVDVLQPCVIFNDKDIREQYKAKVYKLDDVGYKPDDKFSAYQKAGETEKLPIGVIYRSICPTYESQLPQLSKLPLAKQEVKKGEISELLKEFR
ncbi:MAG: thiamine pyrophosphate-dependent enzyme [Patescibacteria group bacterium]|jgi:2-oxoglutarate ferredoxin oxidoreductase subunit beta